MILKKNTINPTLLTNAVFGFFPISFILGNLIINLNILLFCILGIFHLRSKIIKINYNFAIKIIFLFFFIVFLSTVLSLLKHLYIDGYEYDKLIPLVKSIAFFRFFLMLVIAYLLSKDGILDFKYFIISATFFPILISLDVIFQYIFGFNVVGIERFSSHIVPAGLYHSSFFGDELIAGSFIKNFSFFAVLFFIFGLNNKNKMSFLLTTLIICILGTGILLSGNKMPLPLYIFGLILIFFLNNDLKKIILTGLVGLFIIFNTIFYFDEAKKANFLISFYGNARYSLIAAFKKYTAKDKNLKPHYQVREEKQVEVTDFESFWKYGSTLNRRTGRTELFATALELWNKKKIFGGGIKSFRRDCIKLQMYNPKRLCSTHPHNYYVEILTETGIVGASITLFIGLIFFIFIFKNLKFFKGKSKKNLILLAAIVSLLAEVFPIRGTGSIFTTQNAAYLILITSIILSDGQLTSSSKPDHRKYE